MISLVASAYCLSVERHTSRTSWNFDASEEETGPFGPARLDGAFDRDKRDAVLIHVVEDTKPDYPRYVSQNILREDAHGGIL